jgi:hypothetical protein
MHIRNSEGKGNNPLLAIVLQHIAAPKRAEGSTKDFAHEGIAEPGVVATDRGA